MRVGQTLVFLGLSLLSPGCVLLGDATHLLGYQMRESIDECRERWRNKKWAEDAWAEVSRSHPYSRDYGQGFKEGFAAYLYQGGNGEPPLLPPKRYRGLAYQTVAGYQAVQEWFAGYRHGAAVAQQSGMRQLVTGPSGLASADPPCPPTMETLPLAPAQLGTPAAAPGKEQELPIPRSLPAPETKSLSILPETAPPKPIKPKELHPLQNWLGGEQVAVPDQQANDAPPAPVNDPPPVPTNDAPPAPPTTTLLPPREAPGEIEPTRLSRPVPVEDD